MNRSETPQDGTDGRREVSGECFLLWLIMCGVEQLISGRRGALRQDGDMQEQEVLRHKKEDATAFMNRGLKLESRIKSVLAELQEAERSSMTGLDYSAALHGRGKSSAASTERAAIRAAELRELHGDLFLQWLKVQVELTNMIAAVRFRDPRAAMYLTYAYIDGYSMEQIADKMNYTTRRIYQIHHKAIELVRQTLQEAENGEIRPL